MKDTPPFSSHYTESFPQLLHRFGCSLAISTYQASKVIFISAPEPQKLVQLPRHFEKPMGLALDGNQLAIATRNEVVVLANAPRMAPNYPKMRNTYDALYLPRAIYFTGELDIHDLHWADGKLWAVNTRFSNLSLINHRFSFQPVWTPTFIKHIRPSDQCHLNGVAFQDGKPAYVTALGVSDEDGGWRTNKASGGVVMEVATNQIVADKLPMPHSPRLYDDELYILLSGTGELARVNKKTGVLTILQSVDGFARGMDRIDRYLFIGISKIRESSKAFSDLPISKKSTHCGVVIIDMVSGNVEGSLEYDTTVEEIYDVKIIHNQRRPSVLNPEKIESKMALTTPALDYWAVTNEKHE